MTREQVNAEITHMLKLFQGVTAKGEGRVGFSTIGKTISSKDQLYKNYKYDNYNKF